MDDKLKFTGEMHIKYDADVKINGTCTNLVMAFEDPKNHKTFAVEFDTEEMADFMFKCLIKHSLDKEE